jgi:regulator of nucleoside diphosphate kinase
MDEKTIWITEIDLSRLRALIIDAQGTEYRKSIYLKKLVHELDRARVVPSREIPPTVITMNSRVTLLDLDTNEEESYTLVFPEDADGAQGKISILAPIGTAMLGYKAGDTFEWDVPDGERRLRIQHILYQPEASGDFDR